MRSRISTSRLGIPNLSLETSLIDNQSNLIDIMSLEEVTSVTREQDGLQDNTIANGKKDGISGVVEELDVEEGEAHKTFYSKGSVIMMVIFSGLAIGSDG
jgi:hypothetical protein